MIARGHLKSSVVTIGYAIMRLLENPNLRILISNVKWTNAQHFLNQIKWFLTRGSRLPELYGDFKDLKKWRTGWNAESIIIAQRSIPKPEPSIQTAGVECEQTSQHYDICIHDDIVARENINTPDQIEKVKNYYRDSQSLLEPKNSEMIVIGTPWHYNDLYAELRENTDYDVFCRPAYEMYEDKPKIYFPIKFNWETLMRKKKEIGPYLFSAQYLLNPYPEETQEFKESWFLYYDTLPDDKYFIITILDPSLGKKTSNFSAITTTAVNSKGFIYILEARRFKRAVEQLPIEIIASLTKYKSNIFAFEPFGFQQTLYEPIRHELRKAGLTTWVEILPYKNTTPKNARIGSALISKFSSGFIYMKKEMNDLKDELLKFNPLNKNADDDIIDSLAWHYIYWDRKPQQEPAQKIEPYSLQWWLNKNMNDGTKDLLYEFRKDATEAENLPQYAR